MKEPELTPEYIASIASTLTEEELADLIREYGNNEAGEADYWANKNAR